jgi:IclR family KDG regulon transcriptional repressor
VGNAFPTAELVRAATPIMEALVREVGEGAILGVLNGFEVAYVHLVESNQVVRAHARVGDKIPANCTSTGLALLAFQDEAFLDRTIPKELNALSPHTINDPDELRRELSRVRARGYSINRGGWNAEVGGIAAPVMGSHGNVIASLCVALPLFRMNQDWIRRVAPALLRKASEISQSLNGTSAVGQEAGHP